LRLAARSNPKLFEALLDLAWVVGDGEVPVMERLLKPQDAPSKLTLAKYLAKRGKGSDAARQVRETGSTHDEAESAVMRQIIETLLITKQFSEAYETWALTHTSAASSGNGTPRFLNADFVDPIAQNDPGFGWQLSPSTTVLVSIDPAGPVPGTRSICVNFNGESDPGTQLLYQIILVQPKTSYSLSFTARTDDIVSGGPPAVTVIDTSNGKALGQSNSIPTGTSAWKQNEVNFSTEEQTRAIIVSLQRFSCSQQPCPIFGRLWVSRFSLSKV
jgi:hypothetical protein